MSNKFNFNLAEFAQETYRAPITLGKHTVKFGKCKFIKETREDGSDASYILLPTTFEDERVIDIRFYGYGAKIACDQLRDQLNDASEYKNLPAFIQSLSNKEAIDVWVGKRTYSTADGTVKTTLQYDFTEPVESATEKATAEEVNVVDPF